MALQSRHNDYWRRRRRRAGPWSAATTGRCRAIPARILGHAPPERRDGTFRSKSMFLVSCCLSLVTFFVEPCLSFQLRPPVSSPLHRPQCHEHSSVQRISNESTQICPSSTTRKVSVLVIPILWQILVASRFGSNVEDFSSHLGFFSGLDFCLGVLYC